jgi:hypothetical protein
LGDFDLNGWYNAGDIDLLRAARGMAPTGLYAAFDMNKDNAITEQDVLALLNDRLGTGPGDVDLDGDVDAADLARLISGFGQPGAWIAGDVSGDGVVDGADFLLWQRHVTRSKAPTSIQLPEPHSMVPLATTAVLWLSFQVRKWSRGGNSIFPP